MYFRLCTLGDIQLWVRGTHNFWVEQQKVVRLGRLLGPGQRPQCWKGKEAEEKVLQSVLQVMLTVKVQVLLLPVGSVAVMSTRVTPGWNLTPFTSLCNVTESLELSVTSGSGQDTVVGFPSLAANTSMFSQPDWKLGGSTSVERTHEGIHTVVFWCLLSAWS